MYLGPLLLLCVVWLGAGALPEGLAPPAEQSMKWIEAEGCSRLSSRQVRSYLQQAVFPNLPFAPELLPDTCQLNPAHDLYMYQEVNKTEVHRGDFSCGYCGKHFKTEFYLDKHMHGKHPEKLQGDSPVCLGNLCPIFGCSDTNDKDFMELYNKGKHYNKKRLDVDAKQFQLGESCTSSSLERRQYQCSSLIRQCFSPTAVQDKLAREIKQIRQRQTVRAFYDKADSERGGDRDKDSDSDSVAEDEQKLKQLEGLNQQDLDNLQPLFQRHICGELTCEGGILQGTIHQKVDAYGNYILDTGGDADADMGAGVRAVGPSIFYSWVFKQVFLWCLVVYLVGYSYFVGIPQSIRGFFGLSRRRGGASQEKGRYRESSYQKTGQGLLARYIMPKTKKRKD